MPFLKTSIDEPTERVSILVQLASEWKFQTGATVYTEITATFDQSLGTIALATASGVAVVADFDGTLDAATLAAAGGQPTVNADLDQPLDPLTVAGDGTIAIVATVSKMLGGINVSADGSDALVAELSTTLGELTIAATGGEDMYWDAVYNVASSDFTTSSTTLVDVTGLSHAAAADSLYEVEVVLCGQSSSVAGVAPVIAFSAAGATGTWNATGTQTTAAATIVGNALGTVSSTVFWTTSTTNGTLKLAAMVKTGANTGNITAQIKKLTSGSLTVYIGSAMKIKKLA